MNIQYVKSNIKAIHNFLQFIFTQSKQTNIFGYYIDLNQTLFLNYVFIPKFYQFLVENYSKNDIQIDKIKIIIYSRNSSFT